MTFAGWFQIIAVLALVTVAAWWLGGYLNIVFGEQHSHGFEVLLPVERAIARVCGYNSAEQGWKAYTLALLTFNAVGFVFLYLLMRLQAWLPLDPQGFGAVPSDLSFNTAMSFVTNTNWQNYSGEATMSHLTQMAGFTVQNFLSAATGIAL